MFLLLKKRFKKDVFRGERKKDQEDVRGRHVSKVGESITL